MTATVTFINTALLIFADLTGVNLSSRVFARVNSSSTVGQPITVYVRTHLYLSLTRKLKIRYKRRVSIVSTFRKMSCHEHKSLSPLSRQTIGSQLHRISHYKRPNTAASAPAPAPSMGNAVATAPESVTALPAALVTELAAEFAFEVAAPTAPPALLVTELAALEALPGALVAVTSAGKTVVRVRVSVSSRSSPSSSISVEVVVKVLVIMDTEDEEVMVPLPALVAAPALKVVDEKPQELTTSSTSLMGFVNCGSYRREIHCNSPF